jgi:predicted CopG family antitoxin
MGKTITIEDDVYKLLLSLKREQGDSFSKVLRRHVARPANTCGELEEAMDKMPPPEVDLHMLERIRKERGRRSGGRK